jgi:hypothetical protein
MSYCININSFENDNVSIGKEFYYMENKMNNIYYKYDFNISSEFKLLTGFINIIDKPLYRYNNIVFKIESSELKKISNYLESIIPNIEPVKHIEHKYNKHNKYLPKKNIIYESESESEDDMPKKKTKNKIIYESESEDDIPKKIKKEEIYSESEDELDLKNIGSINKKDIVYLYFKNYSELKLNPIKKSNLGIYNLNNPSEYTKIFDYYPNNNYVGNFILKVSIVNDKVKFIIQSGDLKHPLSFTQRDNIKNIYDTKIVIDI